MEIAPTVECNSCCGSVISKSTMWQSVPFNPSDLWETSSRISSISQYFVDVNTVVVYDIDSQ